MEPADLRDGDDPATWRGFDDSWLGTVVVKRLVWPHGVVVGEVRPQEATQMSVIENEKMVEALSSNRADDPLCEGILPGRAGGGEDLTNSHTLDSPRELLAVDRVSITEQEPGNRIVRECLDDLPGGPDCRGVVRDVDMEEFAAVVAEHDEDEEQAEGDGRDHEEVDGDDVVDVGL
jgi:hypothetical protein